MYHQEYYNAALVISLVLLSFLCWDTYMYTWDFHGYGVVFVFFQDNHDPECRLTHIYAVAHMISTLMLLVI